MFEKLQEIERRFAEIEKLMADPSVVQDRDAYQKYSREHADLSPIVETFRRYKKICEEMEKSRDLLEDSDPEIKALAIPMITRMFL